MDGVLSEVLKGMAIAALPAFFGLVSALFTRLQAWVEAQTKNEYLIMIEREAADVVRGVAQTIADPLKEMAKDGKLTDEEKQKVKQIALEALRARAKLIPVHLFPDLESRLSGTIESQIQKMKGGQ